MSAVAEQANGGRPELPEGWERVALESVAEVRSGLAKGRKTKAVTQPRPYLRAGNLGNGELLLDEIKEIEATEAEAKRFRLMNGDVLLVEGSGSPPRLGQGWIWEGQLDDCLHQNHVFAVRPDRAKVEPRYLAWALQAPDARQQLLDMAKTTSGLSTLNKKQASSIEIPLPPLQDQQRIVERLGLIFGEFEQGDVSLREADERLDNFFAAVLEAVCLGTLLGESSRSSGRANGLPAVPSGWGWVELAVLAANEPRAITDGPFGSNLKTAHYTETGPRVIRLQNIGEGEFLDAEAHISTDHFERLKTHEARAGDIVMASLGEAPPRACVVPEWLGPAIVKADCPRMRVAPEVNADFLVACLNSAPVRRQAEALTHGMGRQRLKLADAKKLKVPNAPRAEQDALVAKMRELREACVALEKARHGALLRSRAARRATLAAAMTGQLAA
ncbi:MAG: restriction endonuclease subunit S [Actinomycetota bacterium]|nr:restriction endonuclease subunit S [Actinomycetota bacterium]